MVDILGIPTAFFAHIHLHSSGGGGGGDWCMSNFKGCRSKTRLATPILAQDPVGGGSGGG